MNTFSANQNALVINQLPKAAEDKLAIKVLQKKIEKIFSGEAVMSDGDHNLFRAGG